MLEKSREDIRKMPLDAAEEEIEFFAPALIVNLLLIEFIKRGLELSTYEPAKIEEREKAGLNPERFYLKFRGNFKEEQIKALVDALERWYRSAYDFLPLETTDEEVIAAVEWSPTLYDEMTLRGIERHFANVYDVCPEYIEEYKNSIVEKKDEENKCDLKDPLIGLERVQSQNFAIKKFRRVNNHDPEAKLIDPTLIRCKVNEKQLLALDRATSKIEEDIRKELHGLWFKECDFETGS